MAQRNYFGSFMQGQQAGRQAQEYEQKQQDRNALRTLAPQILAGDPGAFDQAAAIDPRGATAIQEAGDSQLRRLKGALDYFGQGLQSGDDRLIQARFKEISPFMSRITGKEAPPAWTADMMPAFEQARQRVAMVPAAAGEAAPAGYRQFEMMAAAAGLKPGTPEYAHAAKVALGAEGRASSAGYSQVKFTGADGRERIGVLNGRTGQIDLPDGTSFNPQTGQIAPTVGAQPPTRFRNAQGQVMDLSQVDDPRLRQNIAENPDAWGLVPDGGSVSLPPQAAMPGGVGGGTGAFVGRSAEEETAATEAAKLGVQLQYLPQELALRSQAAVDQAVGIEQGKTAAEKAAAAPGTIATLQASVDSIDQLLNSRELGSIVGLGSLNPLNRVPGTAARGLIARADQIAGQAFLAAFNQLKGGGAITEREGAAATAAMARLDRSQSEEDYRRALTDLRDAITPAIARARQQAGGAATSAAVAPAAVRRARNPQTGEMLVLRNGQWVTDDGR
ncbi:hypothetical protein CSC62_05490 [Pseudoxanthomonas jiangsuensis]|uniref:hypothetical protein n=1 Tax=Pseudoxanthomonas jiangsuensis TaxID=619688 RepID=UPI001390ADE9|nr:hypothetical protein [Pseudoxanthomonas jiangsuensis]KAF1698362.1 hypothetical protein CSC62_05490 [Pseudoxanthomonas jiangsuensis]